MGMLLLDLSNDSCVIFMQTRCGIDDIDCDMMSVLRLTNALSEILRVTERALRYRLPYSQRQRDAGLVLNVSGSGPAAGNTYVALGAGDNEPAASRGKISKVDVAVAHTLPLRSVSFASANPVRRPIDTMLPSARTGPLASVSGR